MLSDYAVPIQLCHCVVRSSFYIVASRTVSTDASETLRLNRQLRHLEAEGLESVFRSLQSVNKLAGALEFADLREAITAVAHSLPQICSNLVNAIEIRAAGQDVTQLVNLAKTLGLPDIASELEQTLEAILAIRPLSTSA